MTTTTTPEQALADLRQRIADGDTSVTAVELQQAESAVQIAGLQAEGRERREAEAEHQAKLDELAEIRKAVENDLPNISEDLSKKLLKIDSLIAEAVKLANGHDTRVATYSTRIRDLTKQGATIEGLDANVSGIIAGDRIVGLVDLNAHITRAARRRSDYPSKELTLADGYKPSDRKHVDNSVTVTFLKDVGGHRKDDTARLAPSQAERMIDGGYAEQA